MKYKKEYCENASFHFKEALTSLIDLNVDLIQLSDRELVTVECDERRMEEGAKYLKEISKLLEIPIVDLVEIPEVPLVDLIGVD